MTKKEENLPRTILKRLTILLVFLCSLFCNSIEAKKFDKPIRVNRDITFTVSKADSTLHIDGVGDIPDYRFKYKKNIAPWGKYGNDYRHIVISDGIRSLGECSFANIWNDKDQSYSVSLPQTLREIKNGAFRDTPVIGIDIPSRVKSVGEYAFYGTRITGIRYSGKAWDMIREKTFLFTHIDSLIIPSSIKRICEDAFCGNFSYVDLNNVSYVESSAFSSSYSTRAEEIVARNPELKLSYDCLGSGRNLKRIDIPSSAELIKNYRSHNVFSDTENCTNDSLVIVSFWNMPIRFVSELSMLDKYYGLNAKALLSYIEKQPKYLAILADDARIRDSEDNKIYYCEKLLPYKSEVPNWEEYRNRYELALYKTKQFDKLNEHLQSEYGVGGYERMGKRDNDYYVIGASYGDQNCINHVVNSNLFDKKTRLKYLDKLEYSTDEAGLWRYLKLCNNLSQYDKALNLGLPLYNDEYCKLNNYNGQQIYSELIRAFEGKYDFVGGAMLAESQEKYYSAGRLYEKGNMMNKAVRCYEADKSQQSNNRLGEIYEKGIGLDADLQLARVYYLRANNSSAVKRVEDKLSDSHSQHSNSNSNSKALSLSNGKHYKVSNVTVAGGNVIPFEADICIYNNNLVFVIGDGNGNADDMTLITLSSVQETAAKRIYKTANGTVSFFSVKSQRLGTDVGMMTIEKNGITNGYLFGLTPYDKPTLVQ